jgi:MEDS: MEthanogen/methylotroph, DcmR Sensory domain
MSITRVLRGNDAPFPPTAQSGTFGHLAHAVQFYGKDSFLLDELSRFIGAALGAGDAAVVIATKAHRDGLAQRLQSLGLDVTRAFEQGRYLSLDAAETLAKFMRGNWPDAALFTDVIGSVMSQAAAAAGGTTPHIAAFGEMVALLWAQGNPEAAVRLERLWNGLAKTYPFSLRCAYPMSGFDREDHSDAFLKICAEHSHVIPVESYTALIDEEQRFRSITHLQQKAQALETEMAERKQVEEMLRRASPPQGLAVHWRKSKPIQNHIPLSRFRQAPETLLSRP